MSEVDNIIAQQIVSPELHADGSVTFRVRAPHAESVKVLGIHGLPDFTLEKQGELWSGTIGPLPPERYSYTLSVDGAEWVDPSNRDLKPWLSCASQFEIPGSPPMLHEQTEVAHGAVTHHIYHSVSMNTQRGVYVYTPPGYDDTQSSFPVLYLFHGYGDDESAWLKIGRANLIVDNLIDQAKIKPLVMVMPYGHPLPINLNEEFDAYSERNVEKMEDDLLNDLWPLIHTRYRISDSKNDIGIAGLSMGGGQSLTIGIRNADKFGHVGGFSAACPQGDQAEELTSLAVNKIGSKRLLKTIWIGCGEDDFLLERNRTFVNQLNRQQIAHTYVESAGDHDWMVWRRNLAEFLAVSFPAE